MSAANIIAGYAALVATASLTWQALTRRSDKEPRLQLDVDLVVAMGFPGEVTGVLLGSADLVTDDLYPHWSMKVNLSNIGRSKLQVTALEIVQPAPEGNVRRWDATRRLQQDHRLDPGGTWTYRFQGTDLKGADLRRPFQVAATVSPGRRFEITRKIEDGIGVYSTGAFIRILEQLGFSLDQPGISISEIVIMGAVDSDE